MHYVLGFGAGLPLSIAESQGSPDDRYLYEKLINIKHVPPRILPEPPRSMESVIKSLRQACYEFITNKPIKPALALTYLGPFKVFVIQQSDFPIGYGTSNGLSFKGSFENRYGIEKILSNLKNSNE
ncbi:unnamed protein product [Lepeophtheirus salmonis]|uniref:(salmon louse) hypothetical protein n=1 Tax=Lepeophtheirus salmonis TaxID=72036 RepID=A0A7R8D2V7_LEPSM|nr:unnamed protein product [Lepeophtheirus salmonis]CAF2977882.1 unnamed protein product [Lepeophtheirus salmonis]